MRKLILLSLLIASISAQTVNFKETKFVEALELYTYRDGNVSYSEQKTVVQYKDGKTITKEGNTLTVQNSDKEVLTTLNLNERPAVALYFQLTKALFSKNLDSLKENFEITKPTDDQYRFSPKGDMKKAIKNISLDLQKDGSVAFFVINFENKDTIKIETK